MICTVENLQSLRAAYDKMVEGAKQLTIFGTEEELDSRDFIFDMVDDTGIPCRGDYNGDSSSS
nr:hypothetical protein [uncultured Butyrivibrio sp.]